jgi:hypothetical protein
LFRNEVNKLVVEMMGILGCSLRARILATKPVPLLDIQEQALYRDMGGNSHVRYKGTAMG